MENKLEAPIRIKVAFPFSLYCSIFNHKWIEGLVPPELNLSVHYCYWICKRCGAETDSKDDL